MSWLKKERDLLAPTTSVASSPITPRSPSPFYTQAMTKKRLRIVASGTLFTAHTVHVPFGGNENANAGGRTTVLRAQSVSRTRGGSAATILSVLCQFNPPLPKSPSPGGSLRNRGDSSASTPPYLRGPIPDPVVEAWLVAPLGRGPEASALLNELEREGIRTKFCARREGEGVPSAYVIRTSAGPGRKSSRTIINYNPIPDLTHEEFIRTLSPLLYPVLTPSASPTSPSYGGEDAIHIPSNEPPFDWLHFEGRTAQTTLSNMTGLDGLARDRGWRSRMVFSLDCMRAGRPGQEALVPHADVIFFSKSYARSLAYTSPRAFLLAQALRAAPHSLLIVSWADQGSALLSVPTREYFQSSKFVVEPEERVMEYESVRSSTVEGSGLGHSTSTSSAPRGGGATEDGRRVMFDDDADEDDDDVIDESGADDAFVAGMIYSLSRRVLPNPTYSPVQPPATQSQSGAGGKLPAAAQAMLEDDLERGRWRLEECLRFATEMAGRKVRIKGFAGLARAMENVGWFND
ncbi:hypothetical protein FRB90_004911 [Tulasnella sp. 427]|nr:hypothetical protein FRB90_004911 [Tulasnella sp. 427]